ncbi:unnamed protein product [Lepeophtheirus salmonis]|uniref:(salmon louse) hypothetical protein n=1 Tax=Lepeophtheirus salmonis TaxID=72036 RepID=A0A7R8H4C6_LEPSM|nr:unnamed protein product [Lepeophtheirus salmonis]CAF2845408.1 unnamed protein product [Lepeophtheirus salmonis]
MTNRNKLRELQTLTSRNLLVMGNYIRRGFGLDDELSKISYRTVNSNWGVCLSLPDMSYNIGQYKSMNMLESLSEAVYDPAWAIHDLHLIKTRAQNKQHASELTISFLKNNPYLTSGHLTAKKNGIGDPFDTWSPGYYIWEAD